jgi:hypothetical protein
MVTAHVAGAARPDAAAPSASTDSANPGPLAPIADSGPSPATTSAVDATTLRLIHLLPVCASRWSISAPPAMLPAATPRSGIIVITLALAS